MLGRSCDRPVLFAVLFVVTGLPLAAAPSAQAGEVSARAGRPPIPGVDISPAGAEFAWAAAVNNAGQVLVWGTAAGLIWQRGTLTDVGSLGGGYTRATDINERG